MDFSYLSDLSNFIFCAISILILLFSLSSQYLIIDIEKNFNSNKKEVYRDTLIVSVIELVQGLAYILILFAILTTIDNEKGVINYLRDCKLFLFYCLLLIWVGNFHLYKNNFPRSSYILNITKLDLIFGIIKTVIFIGMASALYYSNKLFYNFLPKSGDERFYDLSEKYVLGISIVLLILLILKFDNILKFLYKNIKWSIFALRCAQIILLFQFVLFLKELYVSNEITFINCIFLGFIILCNYIFLYIYIGIKNIKEFNITTYKIYVVNQSNKEIIYYVRNLVDSGEFLKLEKIYKKINDGIVGNENEKMIMINKNFVEKIETEIIS